MSDFDPSLIPALLDLAKKHNFLIFEDRKFADIGSTVKLQYSEGIHKIASWADIIDAHPIPGDGIVKGLAEIGEPLGRGLALLAEMSSAGSLAVGDYTKKTGEMAKRNRGFVIGFIGQSRLSEDIVGEEDFIYMTPGVGLVSKGDHLGQQYRTPSQVILSSGADVIIVGRGIYGSEGDGTMEERAEMYRKAGWEAYLQRVLKQ